MARAGKVRLVPVPGQIEKILKSQEMVNHLATIAADIRARCGPGFESEAQRGRKKALAMVWADTWEARRDNARHQILLRAVGRRIG